MTEHQPHQVAHLIIHLLSHGLHLFTVGRSLFGVGRILPGHLFDFAYGTADLRNAPGLLQSGLGNVFHQTAHGFADFADATEFFNHGADRLDPFADVIDCCIDQLGGAAGTFGRNFPYFQANHRAILRQAPIFTLSASTLTLLINKIRVNVFQIQLIIILPSFYPLCSS